MDAGKTTLAKGTVAGGRLRLSVRRRLKAGSYRLTLTIAGKRTTFTVKLR